MMSSSRGISNASCKYPFTPSQWQELEHQALIYKYMVSGIPIPSDLILPLRRSFLLESAALTSPSLAFPPQNSMGWGCFQLGFGRKAEDPEPGRCRRTDGKKWRCSKEAYPDSKYCERHMHRGKNRSRKPVEMSLAAGLSGGGGTGAVVSPAAPALSISTPQAPPAVYQQEQQLNFMYPYTTSSSKPAHVSSQQQHSYCNLEAATAAAANYGSAERDYRYLYHHGMKDHVDGYSFLSEGVRMGSIGEKEQHNMYSLGRDDSEEKQQHCFVLGADFKLDRPVKHEDQKPLRHFFDEWPQKSKDSWAETENDHGSLDSYSKTQLSISIPMAHHDFPIISSRYTTD